MWQCLFRPLYGTYFTDYLLFSFAISLLFSLIIQPVLPLIIFTKLKDYRTEVSGKTFNEPNWKKNLIVLESNQNLNP